MGRVRHEVLDQAFLVAGLLGRAPVEAARDLLVGRHASGAITATIGCVVSLASTSSATGRIPVLGKGSQLHIEREERALAFDPTRLEHRRCRGLRHEDVVGFLGQARLAAAIDQHQTTRSRERGDQHNNDGDHRDRR